MTETINNTKQIQKNGWHPFIKGVVIYAFFMLLHYLPDLVPYDWTQWLTNTNESVYQHMKVVFFAFTLASFFEYFFNHKRIISRTKFIFSRFFSSIFTPLVVMPIFLISPLLFGKINTIAGEVIWANIALILSLFVALNVEKHVEQINFSHLLRVIIIALFLVMLVEFIAFTNQLPWFDILATPPGW